MDPKELAKWWEENYKNENVTKRDVEILKLNEEDFQEFVLEIKNIDALQNLCVFLKGALDERREKYFDLLMDVSDVWKDSARTTGKLRKLVLENLGERL